MKKWFSWLLIALAGLLLLSVAGTWWLYRDVIRQLNALRTHTVARYYRVDFDKITPQFFSRSIRIDSFRLYPTDSAMALLKEGALPYLIRNSFSTMQLKKVAFRKFIYNNELDIGALVVKNPSISYLFYPDTLKTGTADTASAGRLDRDNLMPMHIGEVRLNNVALTLEDVTRREPLLRLDSTALEMTGFFIRDWDAADPLHFSTFDIHLKNFQTTILPGHLLKAPRIDISLQDSLLSIVQPSLLPLALPDNRTPLQLHISMDNMLVNGVDMHALLVTQTVRARKVSLQEPEITVSLPDTTARKSRKNAVGKVSNLRLDLRELEMRHAGLIVQQAGRPARKWLEGSNVNITVTNFRKADSLITSDDLDLNADTIESVFLHHRLELQGLHYSLHQQQVAVKSMEISPATDSTSASLKGGVTLQTGPWRIEGFSLAQFLFNRRLNLRHVTAGEGKLLIRLPLGLEEVASAMPDSSVKMLTGGIAEMDIHHWTVMLQEPDGTVAFMLHNLSITSDSLKLPLFLEDPLYAFSRIGTMHTGDAVVFFPGAQKLSLRQGSWQRGKRLLTADRLSFNAREDSSAAQLTAQRVAFKGISLLPALRKQLWTTDSLLVDSATLTISDQKAVARGSVFSRITASLRQIPLPVRISHIRAFPLSLQLEQPRKNNDGLNIEDANVQIGGLALMPDSDWHYDDFTIRLPGISLTPFPGYHLSTDSISIDIGRGSLEVKHPLLLAREDYVHKGVSVNVQTDDMLLNGVDVERLLESKELDAGELEVVSPKIFVTLYPGALSGNVTWQPALQEGYPFSLDALRIRNAYVSVTRADEQEPLFTLEGTGLQVDNLHTLPAGSRRMMDFSTLQLSSHEFSSPIRDHHLLIRDFHFNSSRHAAWTGAVSYMPVSGKLAFSKKLKTGRDWIRMTSGGINISGFNIRSFFSTGILRSQEVIIRQPQIYAYRDKRVPDPTRYQPLPMVILQDAALPLWVDTLRFEHGNITYEVQKPGVPNPLSIYFSGLTGWISPVTTIFNGFTPVDSIQAEAEARLMGEDKLQAVIRFNAGDPHGFTVSGRLDNLSFRSLDTLLGSASKLRFAGGTMDSLLFRFSGDDEAATGKLRAHYQHLRLKVIRKETGKKAVLASLLVNLLIRGNNEGGQKKLYTAGISFQRDTTKGIFNYWWNALKSGLIDAVLPLKQGKKKQRLKQWILNPSKKEDR